MNKRQIARGFIGLLLIATGLADLVGCASEREDETLIDVTLDRSERGEFRTSIADSRLTINVVDRVGINGLTAKLTKGNWPEEVMVNLPLQGLERLEIYYGNYTITTGRSSNDSPDPPLILYVTDENGNVTSAPVSSLAYFPEIDRTTDGFQITLPPHFYREAPPSFSLQWIDFYRQ